MKHQEFANIAIELRDVMLSIGREFFGNEEDAKDVAQEGLLTLCKYIEQLNVDKNHRPLAIRVAKHCCIDMVRKRKKQIPMVKNYIGDYAPPGLRMGTSPQEELENKEWRLAMHEAVSHLNETERKVFEMRQLQGISLDEISSSVHIAKSSAKSMISAARKKIFEELKQKMKS